MSVTIKRILLICLTSSLMLLLQACVPIAFATGAAIGGTIISDSRSTMTMLDDRNIAYTAQMRLDAKADLRNKCRVSVTVFNRIVLLVGQAPNADLRIRAANIVNTVPKIKRIYNQIEIGTPLSTSEVAHDSWLTTKVKTALLAEKGLHSTQLKITTENSVVYLMGVTSRSQASLAAIKASSVDDVAKVVKLFEYTE